METQRQEHNFNFGSIAQRKERYMFDGQVNVYFLVKNDVE